MLDQGYWPDGLYTPPSDEAMQHDLKVAKELGFNIFASMSKWNQRVGTTGRDKLGLLVWQDMPSGDAKGPWPQMGRKWSARGISRPVPERAEGDGRLRL